MGISYTYFAKSQGSVNYVDHDPESSFAVSFQGPDALHTLNFPVADLQLFKRQKLAWTGVYYRGLNTYQ